jgi:mono/diheme cytochrome c family protein
MAVHARGVVLGCIFLCACGGETRLEPGASLAPHARPRAASGPDARSCRAPLGLDAVAVEDGRAGSTVVLARVHGRLVAYAADEEAKALRVLDVEDAKEIGAVPVAGKPGRMVMMSGGRLAVTLTDRAEVAVFSPSPLSDAALDLRCTMATPDEPVDLALTPKGERLLVASDWGHAVTAFDPETGERRSSVGVARGPRALLVAADGRHAYLAHAAGRAMTTLDLRDDAVAEVDLGGESRPPSPVAEFDMEFEPPMPPPPPRIVTPQQAATSGPPLPPPLRFPHRRPRVPVPRAACQGFALAELVTPEPRVLEAMVEVSTGNTSVPSSGYGPGASVTPELPVVAVVDEAKGAALASSVSPRESLGRPAKPPCLLPRASVVAGDSLYVACMGIDALIEYDATSDAPEEHEKRRWAVAAGPTGVAVHGARAVVWSEFGGAASVISLADSNDQEAPRRIAARRAPRSPDEAEVALGRVIFHATGDKRISSDGRACASCHPDGRDDGLVWSTPGGPRQTPMLAGRLPETAPYGWDGAGSDVPHHLTHTFARLEGTGLAPHERSALVRYVTTLEGPSVHAHDGAETLARGRAVFFESGCGSCHSPEGGYADGKTHDVKSRGSGDTIDAFDTPSLRFAAGTAPYFHDGRYATLQALLTDTSGPMGAASSRSPEDLAALETFLGTL